MPAIQPARLKQQAALLAGHFSEPPAFIRSLHHLLDQYADRTQRPGLAGASSSLLTAYRVQLPVLRQIVAELAPLADEQPQDALLLVDALWEQPYLECRLLAAALIGKIPADCMEAVIERVERFIRSKPEERILNTLLEQGLARLRREKPGNVFILIESWLSKASVNDQKNGLRALLAILDEGQIENLPTLFRLIQPFTRSVAAVVRPELLDVLISLARCSPRETAFFLRQSLELPNSPDTPWLIRQTARYFPADIQESLRAAVRGVEWKPETKSS